MAPLGATKLVKAGTRDFILGFGDDNSWKITGVFFCKMFLQISRTLILSKVLG